MHDTTEYGFQGRGTMEFPIRALIEGIFVDQEVIARMEAFEIARSDHIELMEVIAGSGLRSGILGGSSRRL